MNDQQRGSVNSLVSPLSKDPLARKILRTSNFYAYLVKWKVNLLAVYPIHY